MPCVRFGLLFAGLLPATLLVTGCTQGDGSKDSFGSSFSSGGVTGPDDTGAEGETGDTDASGGAATGDGDGDGDGDGTDTTGDGDGDGTTGDGDGDGDGTTGDGDGDGTTGDGDGDGDGSTGDGDGDGDGSTGDGDGDGDGTTGDGDGDGDGDGAATIRVCSTVGDSIGSGQQKTLVLEVQHVAAGTVGSVEVEVLGQHDDISDLTWSLEKGGTEVTIGRATCGEMGSIDAFIADAYTTPVDTCIGGAWLGNFTPDSSFAPFTGMAIAGLWEIKASDDYINDGGTLDLGCVVITPQEGRRPRP